MTNIDAKTPQLVVIKRLFDAYCTRDTRNVLPLLAKDFKAQSFPKRPELPDEAREEHVKKWGGIQSLLSKIEVVVHEVIEAPGKVVSQVTFRGTGLDGTELDDDTLFIFTLVEEEGELKIVGQKDFTDTEKRGKLYSWAAKAMAKQTA